MSAKVKPLVWHKSHMPSWNDDWHTTTPIIYTIRCADENGWKWSFHGGQGYESSPEFAKAAAQADYEARILSALEPAPEGQQEAEQAFKRSATNDQIAAVMLQHGNDAQKRDALTYAGVSAPQAVTEAISEIQTRTFVVQHNPNCPDPWLVRLPGKTGVIDMKHYGDIFGRSRNETGDVLGFGKTFDAAARAALSSGKGDEWVPDAMTVEACAKVADIHASRAWEIANQNGQNDVCASGRNHSAREIATAIRALLSTEGRNS